MNKFYVYDKGVKAGEVHVRDRLKDYMIYIFLTWGFLSFHPWRSVRKIKIITDYM